MSSIFYTFQYKNPLPPIYPPIYEVNFSSIYIPQYEPTWYSIAPLVNPLWDYPVMFNDDDNEKLYREASMVKVEGILKYFQPDKSPGADGWTPDFFLHFRTFFLGT